MMYIQNVLEQIARLSTNEKVLENEVIVDNSLLQSRRFHALIWILLGLANGYIHSIFDIAGKNELGLTKTFGVILRKDKTLFNKFLHLVLQHPPSISQALFSKTEFFFEKSHRKGRTDIEIVNDEIHVIIESKIGTNRIRFRRADRYCNRLSSSISKHKCFVFLTGIGNIEVDQSLERKYPNIKFGNCSWNDTLGLFNLRKKIIVNLVQEYESYLVEASRNENLRH